MPETLVPGRPLRAGDDARRTRASTPRFPRAGYARAGHRRDRGRVFGRCAWRCCCVRCPIRHAIAWCGCPKSIPAPSPRIRQPMLSSLTFHAWSKSPRAIDVIAAYADQIRDRTAQRRGAGDRRHRDAVPCSGHRRIRRARPGIPPRRGGRATTASRHRCRTARGGSALQRRSRRGRPRLRHRREAITCSGRHASEAFSSRIAKR